MKRGPPCLLHYCHHKNLDHRKIMDLFWQLQGLDSIPEREKRHRHFNAVFHCNQKILWTSRILMASSKREPLIMCIHNEYSENPISRTEIAPRISSLRVRETDARGLLTFRFELLGHAEVFICRFITATAAWGPPTDAHWFPVVFSPCNFIYFLSPSKCSICKWKTLVLSLIFSSRLSNGLFYEIKKEGTRCLSSFTIRHSCIFYRRC